MLPQQHTELCVITVMVHSVWCTLPPTEDSFEDKIIPFEDMIIYTEQTHTGKALQPQALPITPWSTAWLLLLPEGNPRIALLFWGMRAIWSQLSHQVMLSSQGSIKESDQSSFVPLHLFLGTLG